MTAGITLVQSGNWSPGISTDAAAGLMSMVGDTLHWCTAQEPDPFDFSRVRLVDGLQAVLASFVTLHKEMQLRGCMGSLKADEPLYQSVHQNAIRSATCDSRFPRLTAGELPAVDFDISILSEYCDIAGTDEFVPGRHGILIHKDDRSAVYLPQVATEMKWNAAQTLQSLCRKAGLPEDAWASGARLSIFETVMLRRN